MTQARDLDYLGHLARESARFASVMTATAPDAHLDCWLWWRPTRAAIEWSGDQAVIDEFDAIIADGIG